MTPQMLTDSECWNRLPKSLSGCSQPLPAWARAIAVHLPRTAAAMLQLNFAHRTVSPIDPVLRSKMRWVIADANRCEYSKAYAVFDIQQGGASGEISSSFTGNPDSSTEDERESLEFVRLVTVAARTISDEMFQ